MFRDVIFDLDGTLFDSLPSIESSVRLAITRVLPGQPVPDLRKVVGPPVAQMFARLWPELPEEHRAALLAEFREIYDSTGCLGAIAYPGALALLEELRRRGLRLFVLTNKPQNPTIALLKHHGLEGLFNDVLCPDSLQGFSRKPDGARILADRHAMIPSSTLLVGDGIDDLDSARRCGFHFAYAAYGYGKIPLSEGFTRLADFASLAAILNPADPS